MSILCDEEIIDKCVHNPDPSMIVPFITTKTNKQYLPSFGLSSYGYDIRLAHTFKELKAPLGMEFSNVIDFKTPITKNEYDIKEMDEYYILHPNEFVLAHSLEYFNMPKNITGLVKDKSTYARCGIALQNTVLEAGWSGQITLEISNHGPRPVTLYCEGGIAQILFFKGKDCLNPYNGKYQGDTGVVLPK